MSAFRPRHELLDIRLRRFARLLHGVDTGDIHAVHRTRVASRRLRELVPVLLIDGEKTAKLGRRMRRVTRHLGPVRELDVLNLLIDELHESRRYPERALRRLKDEVTEARLAAGARLREERAGDDLRKVARKLERLQAELAEAGTTATQARGVRWAIDARIARRAGDLKAAIEDAGAVYLAERLHAVRIAVKKLRYAVELAAEAGGQGRSADVAVLKRAQELLGRMHDLQVLVDRVRQVQGALKPPDVIAWREFDAVVAGLETSCRRLHARFVHEREAILALCDRLAAARTPAARTAARRAG